MSVTHRNSIEFRVWGRYALFSDPLTRVGGEKFSYQVPTYEALKGICKSIYWKPTLIWVVDAVRVMKRIRTQTKGMKLPKYGEGGNDLAIYTFLADVEYQVCAHFEWNEARTALEADRNEHKHHNIAKRMLERGGRQDVFLGVRDCQGYVEPCAFGSGGGDLDGDGELSLGVMFHGFDYPDEAVPNQEEPDQGGNALYARFSRITMDRGLIRFERPDQCSIRKYVREMDIKPFELGQTVQPAEDEWAGVEAQA